MQLSNNFNKVQMMVNKRKNKIVQLSGTGQTEVQQCDNPYKDGLLHDLWKPVLAKTRSVVSRL